MDKFNANESVDATRLKKLLLESGTPKILRKNEYMVHQNDKTNHIGFVTSGIFRLTRIDTNGSEWIVHKNTKNGAITGGFDRVNPFQQAEQGFDKLFGYNRQLSESFEYANTMKNGNMD